MTRPTGHPRGELRERLLAAVELAGDYYTTRLHDVEGAGPRRYLAARGLDHVLEAPGAHGWLVGYAPAGWDRLVTHLRGRGFTSEDMLAAGLAQHTSRGGLVDRFRDRITVGVHAAGWPAPDPPPGAGDCRGRLVGFVGRAAPTAGPDVPKYLNTPATVLYDKTDLLLGLHEQRRHPRPPFPGGPGPGPVLVVVEGALDALAVHRATLHTGPGPTPTPAPAHRPDQPEQPEQPGRLVVVSPSGTALTAAHTARLLALDPARVVVAFDDDPPGRAAAVRAYRLFADTGSPVPLRWAPLDGDDPAGYLVQYGPTRLHTALTAGTAPLADLVVDELMDRYADLDDNAETRVNALHATARRLATIRTDDLARQVDRTARRLDVPASQVTGEVADSLTGRGMPLSSRAGPPIREASPTRRISPVIHRSSRPSVPAPTTRLP